MKKHLIGTIMAVLASTSMAFAEDPNYLAQSNANAASQAVANSNSWSGSVASGGNVTFNQPKSTNSRVSGTTTIRSAPQVVAPSMSSGHPCAYAPLSVGISVVGFGGAFGGQRIDDACLIGQLQYRKASMLMIAGRSPAACRALEAAGDIVPGSCGGGRRAVYSAPARTVAYNGGGKNCYEVQATASTKKKVCN